jgi:hypothetical protein
MREKEQGKGWENKSKGEGGGFKAINRVGKLERWKD